VQIIEVGDQLRKGFHYQIQKNISKLFAIVQWNELWCNLYYGKQEVVKVVLKSRVIFNTIPE
jgi:hypothetical protein